MSGLAILCFVMLHLHKFLGSLDFDFGIAECRINSLVFLMSIDQVCHVPTNKHIGIGKCRKSNVYTIGKTGPSTTFSAIYRFASILTSSVVIIRTAWDRSSVLK